MHKTQNWPSTCDDKKERPSTTVRPENFPEDSLEKEE